MRTVRAKITIYNNLSIVEEIEGSFIGENPYKQIKIFKEDCKRKHLSKDVLVTVSTCEIG